MILSSYLANRYAKDQPISLSASLVFEQSYGFVEGDSASAAELCALLSALSKVAYQTELLGNWVRLTGTGGDTDYRRCE